MIEPMVCQLAQKPFDDLGYIFEVKFDGCRCIAKTGSEVRLWARSGRETTHRFPELDIRTKVPAVLDGEIVCYDEDGKPRFNDIQHRVHRENDIKWASIRYPTTYEVFDIVEARGIDLKPLPLMKRKEVLEAVLIPTHNVRVCQYIDTNGIALFRQMVDNNMEGVIAKLKTGRYSPGKRDWLKIKVKRTEEFVICGYTEGEGWRSSTFGALVLGKVIPPKTGVFGVDNTPLVYVGSVGTGFDNGEINRLYGEITKLPTIPCPFGKEPEKAIWIKPSIRVRIEFAEYTNDSRLRFPSYKGEV